MAISGINKLGLVALTTAGLTMGALCAPQLASAGDYEHGGYHDGYRDGAGDSHRWQHHGNHWRHEGRHWQGHPQMRSALMRAMRHLHLTSEQREKMHALLQANRKQRAEQMKSSPPEFAALANPGDPGHAAAVKAAAARAAARVQARSDLEAQLYGVLTPEQKAAYAKELAQMQARMKERQEGHWDHWQHHGHGSEG